MHESGLLKRVGGLNTYLPLVALRAIVREESGTKIAALVCRTVYSFHSERAYMPDLGIFQLLQCQVIFQI